MIFTNCETLSLYQVMRERGEIRGFQHLQISSFHHFKKEFLSPTILKINDLLITIKESSKQRDPGIQFFLMDFWFRIDFLNNASAMVFHKIQYLIFP